MSPDRNPRTPTALHTGVVMQPAGPRRPYFRGAGNLRPVSALVTTVPRATAFRCFPHKLFDGAFTADTQRVPLAVAALH